MSESGLTGYLDALSEAGVSSQDMPQATSAAELIKGLASLALDRGDGPSLLRSPPSRPALISQLKDDGLKRILPQMNRTKRLILAASLLQIHDFWDASHDAAQEAEDLGETRFSAYWHGIAHRREPDAGNASYWFRRVGDHPTFQALRSAVDPVFREWESLPQVGKLARSSRWDPIAMIDLCTHPAGQTEKIVARSIQRVELSVLTAATIDAILDSE